MLSKIAKPLLMCSCAIVLRPRVNRAAVERRRSEELEHACVDAASLNDTAAIAARTQITVVHTLQSEV
jgi:hypothetical protein